MYMVKCIPLYEILSLLLMKSLPTQERGRNSGGGNPVLCLILNIIAPMYSLCIYTRRQQPCNSQDEKWPRFSQFQQWI